MFASLSIAIGATIGFVGGAYLGLAFGWRFVLAVFGVGALGVAAIGVLSVPSTPSRHPPRLSSHMEPDFSRLFGRQ